MNSLLQLIQKIKELDHASSFHPKRKCDTGYPQWDEVEKLINLYKEIIFPQFFSVHLFNPLFEDDFLSHKLLQLKIHLQRILLKAFCFECFDNSNDCHVHSTYLDETIHHFLNAIPRVKELLITDIEATYLGDPAAKSREEVLLCYPGIQAMIHYRIAHGFYQLNVPILPRMITELAHSKTGIDIHPGATIGRFFAMDHGTGIVIGETTIIGENVKIYQGVTLGAKSFPLDEHGNPVKGIPRHPIVEDNVIIYANATILGRVTIGKNSIIGANTWVTTDVPPDSKVTI
jgi:serine O-acetyltransferase